MKKEQGRSFPESTAWFLYIWNKNRGILVDMALGYAWGGGGGGKQTFLFDINWRHFRKDLQRIKSMPSLYR